MMGMQSMLEVEVPDSAHRITALELALRTYDNTTVSPREILALASHYADFIIKGEIEWPEDVKPAASAQLPKS